MYLGDSYIALRVALGSQLPSTILYSTIQTQFAQICWIYDGGYLGSGFGIRLICEGPSTKSEMKLVRTWMLMYSTAHARRIVVRVVKAEICDCLKPWYRNRDPIRRWSSCTLAVGNWGGLRVSSIKLSSQTTEKYIKSEAIISFRCEQETMTWSRRGERSHLMVCRSTKI